MSPDPGDEQALRRLSSLLDRIAAQTVDEALAEVISGVRQEALDLIRRRLLDSLTSRLESVNPGDLGEPEAPSQRERPDVVPDPEPALGGNENGPPDGWYVYAIVDPDSATDLAGVRPVDSRFPLEYIRGEGLAAVTSRVSSSALSAISTDPERLGELARRHDEAVRRVAETTATIPFRLGTVCATPDDVGRLLTSFGPRSRELLAELRDRDEWGVRVIADPVEPEAPSEDPDEWGGGTSYLTRRSTEREAIQQRNRAALDAARDIHGELATLAVRASTSQPTEDGGGAVLNMAYLVDRQGADRFVAAVEQVAHRHSADCVRVRLTGPWPAYTFAAMMLGEDHGG
jgi:hypothetical protein